MAALSLAFLKLFLRAWTLPLQHEAAQRLTTLAVAYSKYG